MPVRNGITKAEKVLFIDLAVSLTAETGLVVSGHVSVSLEEATVCSLAKEVNGMVIIALPFHKGSSVLVTTRVFACYSTSLVTSLEVHKVILYVPVSPSLHAERGVSDVQALSLVVPGYVYVPQILNEVCYPTRLGI